MSMRDMTARDVTGVMSSRRMEDQIIIHIVDQSQSHSLNLQSLHGLIKNAAPYIL